MVKGGQAEAGLGVVEEEEGEEAPLAMVGEMEGLEVVMKLPHMAGVG